MKKLVLVRIFPTAKIAFNVVTLGCLIVGSFAKRATAQTTTTVVAPATAQTTTTVAAPATAQTTTTVAAPSEGTAAASPATKTVAAPSEGAAAASPTTTTTTQQPPNGVEVEIGIGSRIGGPQVSNYQNKSGTLSLTNLGRATPQFLTGLGFSCQSASSKTTVTTATTTTSSEAGGEEDNSFCKHHIGQHLGAFVSVLFASGSNQTIAGYSIGGTYALFQNLRLLAGFTMAPISEVAPGFENAAAQYVSKNPTLFPGVDPTKLASGTYGAFDGIQTTSTAPAAGAAPTAVIYYPGSILENHYRGGFLIGVAFPINVYKLLSGNSKD